MAVIITSAVAVVAPRRTTGPPCTLRHHDSFQSTLACYEHSGQHNIRMDGDLGFGLGLRWIKVDKSAGRRYWVPVQNSKFA